MGMLNREKILAATGMSKPVAVEVPEWEGSVSIKPLTLGGVSKFQAMMLKDPTRAPFVLIMDCVCDENGKRLFSEADEAAIADWPQTVATRLADEIARISKLDEKGRAVSGG